MARLVARLDWNLPIEIIQVARDADDAVVGFEFELPGVDPLPEGVAWTVVDANGLAARITVLAVVRLLTPTGPVFRCAASLDGDAPETIAEA